MRIIITGAESSGKSSLTEYLGKRFNLPFALEFARYYLEENGPEYDLELLTQLSGLHLHYQQEQVEPAEPIGFFDTDLINYKIWAEEVFGCCPAKISAGVVKEHSHVYLVCKPDLPWEEDPLRSNRDDRERLYQRHISEIQRLDRRFEIVEGIGLQRSLNAEEAVRRLINL